MADAPIPLDPKAPPKPIYVVCRACGSPNVTCDAIARWDFESQSWEFSSELDSKDCDDCGYESDRMDEVVEADLTPAQRAVIEDGEDYEAPPTIKVCG